MLFALVPLWACRATDGTELSDDVRCWGSLREVLREGRTERRVEFEAVLGPHSVGIGLVDGLAAEIAVLDGQPWFGSARGADGWTVERGLAHASGATFLVLAEVQEWRLVPIVRDVAADEFDAWLSERADELGLGDTWPFVVEGRLEALEAHVLRGACPLADPDAPEPVRPSWSAGSGRLVGFFARNGGGIVTHHGSSSHTHVVLTTPEPFVGHVDRVALKAGSTLLVSARSITPR